MKMRQRGGLLTKTFALAAAVCVQLALAGCDPRVDTGASNACTTLDFDGSGDATASDYLLISATTHAEPSSPVMFTEFVAAPSAPRAESSPVSTPGPYRIAIRKGDGTQQVSQSFDITAEPSTDPAMGDPTTEIVSGEPADATDFCVALGGTFTGISGVDLLVNDRIESAVSLAPDALGSGPILPVNSRGALQIFGVRANFYEEDDAINVEWTVYKGIPQTAELTIEYQDAPGAKWRRWLVTQEQPTHSSALVDFDAADWSTVENVRVIAKTSELEAVAHAGKIGEFE